MSLLEQLAAKAQVTGDVGDGLDKDLDRAQAEAHSLMGGALWVKKATAGVSGLMELIRKDFEEGKLDNLEGKQVFDLLSEWNRKSVECLLNFAELKKSEALVANGKVVGIKAAMEVVQNHHTAATVRAAQIQQAIASEESPQDEDEARAARRERAPGEHPGASPLDARRVEALKEAVTKKTRRGRKKVTREAG
jgi:hypothetical protein